jgi:uncharacterized protein Yka (UPF0111/DUF47 family)
MLFLRERVETFSSQQTIYLERTVEEDVIVGLQRQMGSFTNDIKRLESQNDALKSQMKREI